MMPASAGLLPDPVEYAKAKARNIAAALLAWAEGKKIAPVREAEESNPHHYGYRDGIPVLYFEHPLDYDPETWHEVQELNIWTLIQGPKQSLTSTTDADIAAKWKAQGLLVVQSVQIETPID